jgi:probable addiction module antidote protein
MKRSAFTAFDVADYLKTGEEVAAYLEAAGETGDARDLVTAMGNVIRAQNVSKIARDTGLTREGLYKAFSAAGNPSFATVAKVARAVGLDVVFHARPLSSARARGSTLKVGRAGRSTARARSTAKSRGTALSRR